MKRFVFVILVFAMCVTGISTTVFAQRDVSREEVLASELKELGLFRGVSETDFDLDREPTRVEALVMLIRVLGKESEVTDGTWKHPFTDVPGWADNYVGYAYSKGLTNGQSATQFGTGNANAATYLTFVLRALGYSDENGKDFAWNDPFTLSKETGILADGVNINEFWRADVVLISHAALSSYLKGSNQTLTQKLISADVFTQSDFNAVYNRGANVTKPDKRGELNAEEIYEKCSPAVFYIEIYDKDDEVIASGSGFFIDNKGTAVTNYHVIDGAYSAYIQTSDTADVYEVRGVYDYNVEEDWAVIKVDCTGNQYLNIGDSSAIVGGSKVYAIGSPLGLQNTISEGIVSNPKRDVEGVTYIQTNAAISNGSSGGALLDKKGEVIGITSAGYTEGQNLNLALPITYIENYYKVGFVKLSSLIETKDVEYDSAYECLYDWVKKNGTKDGKYLVCEYDDGDCQYEIAYDSEYDNIFISCSGYSSDFFYYCNIQLDSLFYGFSFDNLNVYGYLPEKDLNKNERLPYLKYEGDDYLKDDMVDCAKSQICVLIYWLGEFLDDNNISITVEDLGIPSIEIGSIDSNIYYESSEESVDSNPSYSQNDEWTNNTDAVYSKFKTAKFPLKLYSNDGKTFLGELTTNKYDSDSISNEYGSYGSKYSTKSIFNEYGTYGSKYSSQSAFNEYALSPPIIVDSKGNFIAYLTANTYKINGITYYKLLAYLEQFNQ